ncbi:MAG: T9SS type A sorting domain-containing protein, partial [Ignavibacteriales bacterium]|nr:T9SS type A sorting domain-containing protein [Ignavibacteriales bacterium]
SGWIADTNAVGSAILPEDSYTTIIKFVAGKNATGTVWADDFMLYGRNGSWAGQDWNTQVGVPTGWFYWLPPGGGNDGRLSDGYENTKITDEESYQGKYSLKFENLPGTHDGFVGTKKYLLDASTPSGRVTSNSYDITALKDAKPGDVLRVSVWLKAQNLDPVEMSQIGDQASFGITPIFHNTSGNNEGWGEFWSRDIPLKFPSVTSFDWMQFYVDVPVQEGAKSISVRLHPLGRFKGTIYCDLLEVRKLDLVDVETEEAIPVQYTLFQNYPNPFNPATVISYALPKQSNVSLKIYDILGREVRSLLNSEQAPGMYKVEWDGKNDFGKKVATGTYIYTISTGEFVQSKKMILLK